MAVKADDQIYVKVINPLENRKDTLRSAIISAQLLKNCQNFKKIRNEKRKNRLILKTKLKEISSLLKSLEFKEMPSIKVKKEKIVKPEREEVEEIPAKDKLTKEIDEIQEKLKSLEI